MQTSIETKRFIINKIDNITIYLTEIKDNNSTLNDVDSYDPYGAAKYIIIVVLFYGFVIIFFIASQVNSQKRNIDDIDGVNAEKILRKMQDEIFEREVLQKLSNKEHREKAWNIYLEGRPTKTLKSLESQDNEAMNSIQKRFRSLNKDNNFYSKNQEENKPLNNKNFKSKRHRIFNFKLTNVSETSTDRKRIKSQSLLRINIDSKSTLSQSSSKITEQITSV